MIYQLKKEVFWRKNHFKKIKTVQLKNISTSKVFNLWIQFKIS